MKIGIDLGGTNVRIGIVHQGKLLQKIAEPCRSEASEQEVLDHLISLFHRIKRDEVERMGIGVPSVVDSERGIVYNVQNIPSWVKVPLKEILEKEFQIPVAVNNDCNCFALGEYTFGEGISCKDVVCVALGTGVGAGIIIDGKLYNGHNTGAGEIGCLPYLEHNYEYYCGSAFFAKEHNMTGKEAFLRGQANDPAALQVWEQMGFHMGNLMKAILFMYDPQMIILGGSIANAYPFFAPAMQEGMRDFPYPETLQRLRITRSQKEDIALLGASEL